LGLAGGGPLAGFSAAGLPVRAFVFGHGVSPSVDMSPPQGTRWNGQCNPGGRLQIRDKRGRNVGAIEADG
jgi:hypothetical protein